MYPGAWDPSRPAVLLAGTEEVLTFGELERDSIRLARWFADHGLRRGDVVALVSDNRPQALVVYWAARRSGLYLTAVDWHLAAAEAAYVLRDCGACAVVVSAGIAGSALAACAGLADDVLRLAFGGPLPGFAPMGEAMADVSDAPLAAQPKGADMLYSSGTTGRPKGVKPPLPEVDVDDPADVVAVVFGGTYGFGSDTVYLSPAPIYHAAPLRFCGMTNALGGTVVLLDRFDAEGALAAIGRYAVTHVQMVPTMFVRLLKLPEEVRAAAELTSLRVVVHAAAPCPADVKRAMIDWVGPILHEYYAGTEGSGITMIDSAGWLAKPGSVGRPMIGPVHVCADDGSELPAGGDGSIFFESPDREDAPFAYHGDPAKTLSSQHPDHANWTTLGDVGHLDEDGYLFLTDRKAFMIISGGVNIYPQETEDALALHPKVYDVAVIGVPDPEMGEAVKAVIVPAPGVEGGPELEAELLGFVRERLSHHKCPRSIDFVTGLPRTPTGKLVKGRLRAQYL